MNEENILTFLKGYRFNQLLDRAIAIIQEKEMYLVEIELDEFAAFQVPSQSGSDIYSVEIDFKNGDFFTNCTCPFDGYVCKHALASLIYLFEHISGGHFDKSLLSSKKKQNTKQLKTIDITPPKNKKGNKQSKDGYGVTYLPAVKHLTYRNFKEIFASSIPHNFFLLTELSQRMFILSKKEGELIAHTYKNYWDKKKHQYETIFRLDADDNLTMTCTCNHDPSKICDHKIIVFTTLNRMHDGGDLLIDLRNKDKLVEPLLKEYGMSLSDDWRSYFEVQADRGKVYLVQKDPSLSKLGKYANWNQFSEQYFSSKPSPITEKRFQMGGAMYKGGVLWLDHATMFAMPVLVGVTGKRKKNGEIGAPLSLIKEYSTERKISFVESKKLQELTRLDLEFLSATYGLPHFNSSDFGTFLAYAEKATAVLNSLLPGIIELESLGVAEPDIDPYGYRNIPISATYPVFPQLDQRLSLEFEFKESEGFLVLSPLLKAGKEKLPFAKLHWLSFGICKLEDGRIFLLEFPKAKALLFFHNKTQFKTRKEDLFQFAREFLLPLMEQFPVKMKGIQLDVLHVETDFQKVLYIKEVGEQLVVVPAFRYTEKADAETQKEPFTREVEMDFGESLSWMSESGEVIFQAKRLQEQENQFFDFIRSQHPDFDFQHEHFFALPISSVFENNWFFDFFEKLEEAAVEVLGLKELKKVKYSPFRPSVRLSGSSGIDWFGVKMEVSFGDQQVKLADIRKAVMNQQHYVKLSDGSMGILPKEWLEKYSSLLKMGKVKGNKVELSNFQVSLVEEFYGEIDQNKAISELIKKKNKLKEFRKIKPQPLPVNLNANLRNYQVEGYNWLRFLDDYGWGGCLADDMGLGKTLQVLSFLQDLINREKKATCLVVVPRSLVFNWMAEATKFCPDLKLLNHTGSQREKDNKHFKEYHIVLTTYGLVRQDIEMRKEFAFRYVILDESQAIKNPNAQMSKAVKLLQTKNRLIMTGTPIENNTFDLYSQMDFLNPGMLGSLDVFRTEFANKIDRDRDEATAKQLRSIVYPLMLSRKKQDVAKELPEKTETVLYCEMEPAQRKVYDYFKEKYREEITKAIETEGMNKAGMYIIQGLLKLRQICNSPRLLPEEEGEFTTESAKLELLMESLEDVLAAGNKVLVFSYFVGMLELIKEELEKREVGFSWLSGSSSDREAIVKDFRGNPEKKVFLISLKAGGFGLNLTEASYVYMVDPWWNPAVEQQAIDRTHRIGQTQHVFAYKLICKDTIEEKILALQEKKKAVAEDIVNLESGFLKKLDRKDVEALFS